MENIKNIVFDLGGVIMDIDVKQTLKAFSNLGIKDIDKIFGHGFAASFVSDHEAGTWMAQVLRSFLLGAEPERTVVQGEANA